MPAPDLVALNARMAAKILSEPAAPTPAAPTVEGGYALRVVYTTGHRSGQRRATPLGIVQIDGLQYLVSPDRSRAWVRNLAADPRCELAPGDDRRVTVPAPAEQGAPVVAAYLDAMRQMPWTLQSFPVTPGAGVDEITPHLDTIAVLRLDPRCSRSAHLLRVISAFLELPAFGLFEGAQRAGFEVGDELA